MSTFFNECTPIQRLRYSDAYLATFDCINDTAKMIAIDLNNPKETSIGKKLEAERELARLIAARDLHMAKRQSYRAGQQAINPPGAKKVKQAQGLANKIDQEIKNAEIADAAIGIANQALVLFNSIQFKLFDHKVMLRAVTVSDFIMRLFLSRERRRNGRIACYANFSATSLSVAVAIKPQLRSCYAM